MSSPQIDRAPILIVDDDPAAVRLLQQLLKKAGIHNSVVVANDGIEAIAYLERCLEPTAPERPALVLLDLLMPRMDGFGVLEWVRRKPTLKNLLVAVVSSSNQPDDVTRAYALGARSYFSKFPVISDLRSVYHLATAIVTVEELSLLAGDLR
jgi:CheY-like chemotaxis protein